jgi:penicillin-binding protein 2
MIATPPRQGNTRTPVPPSLAVRAAVLGMLALVLFGVLFFRLWYLQVLSGTQYVQQANATHIRELPIQAPRGEILSREGKPIVKDQEVNAVQIVPTKLPTGGRARHEVYAAVGRVLGMSVRKIEALVAKGQKELAYAPVTIANDAGQHALTVLAEHQNELPGVQQEAESIRSYPYGELAAQALGYTGKITKPELEDKKHYAGVAPTTLVGQTGLEHYYDPFLRGRAGEQRIEVNAANEAVRTEPTIEPQRGYNLVTTLSLSLQRASEAALRQGIESAHAAGKAAPSGAFVAMDPESGEVLSIGSYPSFNPSVFSKPQLSQSEYEELIGGKSNNTETGAPMLDRATEALYPTGSSYKPITAIGALEAGVMTPEEAFGPGPCLNLDGPNTFCNDAHAAYPAMSLVEALKVSSDTYFFTVGERAFKKEEETGRKDILQSMAHKLGIGEEDGSELGERAGLVPDAKWREEANELQEKCLRHPPREGCGYVEEIKPWTIGENMDYALGQGSLETDPMQMAVAYSTMVDAWKHGGEAWRVVPHLGRAIEAPDGALVQRLTFPSHHHLRLNAAYLGDIFEGIHKAASEAGGTSADVWAGWNQGALPVYGKTGTAERNGALEQSWYMCYVEDRAEPARSIVIGVTVPQGGYGAETAAPISRLIASAWFNQKGQFIRGASKTG